MSDEQQTEDDIQSERQRCSVDPAPYGNNTFWWAELHRVDASTGEVHQRWVEPVQAQVLEDGTRDDYCNWGVIDIDDLNTQDGQSTYVIVAEVIAPIAAPPAVLGRMVEINLWNQSVTGI